jgi:hypothetical protein
LSKHRVLKLRYRLRLRGVNKMDFNEYQKLAKRTAKDLNIVEFALGISGEAGEVTDLVKKIEFHGHTLDHDETRDTNGCKNGCIYKDYDADRMPCKVCINDSKWEAKDD